MIGKIGQVMLYVNNQDEAVDFWSKKLGFAVAADENSQGMRWIEIVPSEGAETSIVLHDKGTVEKMSPGLDLGTPSLMFFTEDAEKLHKEFAEKNITVGDIMDMPSGKVFNFADNEDHYFAVMEK